MKVLTLIDLLHATPTDEYEEFLNDWIDIYRYPAPLFDLPKYFEGWKSEMLSGEVMGYSFTNKQASIIVPYDTSYYAIANKSDEFIESISHHGKREYVIKPLQPYYFSDLVSDLARCKVELIWNEQSANKIKERRNPFL